MTKDIVIYKMSYNEYNDLINDFCIRISERFTPDFIYGFPKGGLPIAVHASHFFNETPILLNTFEIIEKFKKNHNYKFLIVDDIVDSGKTFKEFYNRFHHLKCFHAALTWKPRNIFKIDLTIKKFDSDIWVKFPWEYTDKPDKDYMFKE